LNGKEKLKMSELSERHPLAPESDKGRLGKGSPQKSQVAARLIRRLRDKGIPYSKPHPYPLGKAGLFPKKVLLGPGRIGGYLEAETDEYIAQKIAAVPAATEDADTPTTTKCAHAAPARTV
jgi:predicted DNA-binding transcriptional regulator AlpA